MRALIPCVTTLALDLEGGKLKEQKRGLKCVSLNTLLQTMYVLRH
jgi:hypothetical protein